MARRTMIDTDADFGVIAHTPTETPPCAPGQSARPVALCLPVPPSANRYWRNMRERMVVSQEAQTYKQHVRRLCDSVDPCTGNVALQFTVFRARKAGDLDNFEKVLLDALKGILYPDDSAVVEIHALRDDDKCNPRVLLRAGKNKALCRAYN